MDEEPVDDYNITTTQPIAKVAVESGIGPALAELDGAIDHLQAALRQMDERIAPFTAPAAADTPASDPASDPGVPTRSPVGQAINQLTGRVRRLAAATTELAGRVDQ